MDEEDPELALLRRRRIDELMAQGGATPRPAGALDASTDFDAYLKAHRLVMADFWAQWCGPCRVMHPLVEQLAQEWAGRIAVAKVNVDAFPALAERYRIQGIPTFLFFRDGTVAGRLVGSQPRAAFDAVAADLTEA